MPCRKPLAKMSECSVPSGYVVAIFCRLLGSASGTAWRPVKNVWVSEPALTLQSCRFLKLSTNL